MSVSAFDLQACIDRLKDKRCVFHSEADFQFALAWEIQTAYPEADVRLEYCPKSVPQMHLDLIVTLDHSEYPIELKYKTAGFNWATVSEAFHLKNHGAQDIGKYDCLIDVMRIEHLSKLLPNFAAGFVVWLTNDASYWKPLRKADAVCRDFSIHEGITKFGTLRWTENAGVGTTKNREREIVLRGSYSIHWQDYSTFEAIPNNIFRYSILEITR